MTLGLKNDLTKHTLMAYAFYKEMLVITAKKNNLIKLLGRQMPMGMKLRLENLLSRRNHRKSVARVSFQEEIQIHCDPQVMCNTYCIRACINCKCWHSSYPFARQQRLHATL